MWNWRNRVASVLLPVLLLVALLPRGYMPDPTSARQGVLTLTICRAAPTAQDGGEGSRPADDHTQGCPFDQLPATSVPVEPVAIPQPSLWGGVASVMPVDIVLPWAVRRHGLGARGPPVG